VTKLLAQYQDVFELPNKLPPERVYDHDVPLLPNAIPVNARPYRYSPLHKDEIERQVKEMLNAGLIVPSTSPFCFTDIADPEKGWKLEILCGLQ